MDTTAEATSSHEAGGIAFQGHCPATNCPATNRDGRLTADDSAAAASEILAFLDEPHNEPHCVVRGFFAAGGTLEE